MPTIDLYRAASYFGVHGTMHQKLRKAMEKGLYSAALRAVQEIQTKGIPDAKPTPIDKGIYKAGWKVKKIPEGAIVYNAVPYAAAIEYGVSSANVHVSKKFAAVLTEWVQRKLGGASAAKAKQMAWAIMYSLKRKGIFNNGNGFRILEKYNNTRADIVIREECEKEIKKAFP